MIRSLRFVSLLATGAAWFTLSAARPVTASPQADGPILSTAAGWNFAGTGPGAPTGQSATDYAAGKDVYTAHNGKSSATIKALSDKPQGFRAMTQGMKAAAYRGKRLRLSGYLKTSNVPDSTSLSGLWMRLDGLNGFIAFNNSSAHPLKGTTDWTRMSVVLDVPEAAQAIYFGVVFQGTGQIWADDLTLEAVDPNTVAADPNPRPVTQADIDAYPTQPTNLDFEEASTGTGPIDPLAIAPGWRSRSATGDYDCRRDTTISHRGSASATIKSNAANPATFRPLAQRVRADQYRGKRIRMTGYLKTSNVQDGAVLWMRVDGADQALTFDNMMDGPKKRAVKGTTDWQAYSIVLDVPEASQAIYFGALLGGPGQLWLDDVALETVDQKQVASTDIEPNLERKVSQEHKKLKSQPVNLDYER